jgi:uracil-DNA glycosylase family 4
MDRARASRLVAQAAETSRLLGVDFVPVYRRGGTGADAPRVEAELAGEASPMVVETKPLFGTGAAAGPKTVKHPVGDVPGAPRDGVRAQQLLDELQARYEREAPHRKFVTAHTKIVFGEGNPSARLMFVGEAPGAEEDRIGRPFVGRSGQLLDKMISAMGLSRDEVYIANVLKTRPPDNATPTFDEIRLCAPYLYEQVGIIGPEVIVTLGLPAARALLNVSESMSRLRGRWATFVPPPPYARPIAVMPTYHPAFLLRAYTPENRSKVWSDLRQAMGRLGLGSHTGDGPG